MSALLNEIPRLNLLTGPISSAQQRIYLDEIIRFQNTSSPVYNIPLTIVLSKKYSNIHDTIKNIVRRHSSLRTNIQNQDIIMQRIAQEDMFVVDYDTITINNVIEMEDVCHRLNETVIDVHSKTFFVRYITDHKNIFHLHFVFHHIAFDGVSSQIFKREFDCFLHDRIEDVDEIECQYLDYSFFEHDFMKTDEMKSSIDWWINLLESSKHYIMDLPLDRLRTANRNGYGKSNSYLFPKDVSSEFNNIIKTQRITIHILVYIIIHIFFSRLNSQSEILIGSINDNRYMTSIENLIGVFVNTIVYKQDTNNNCTLKNYIPLLRQFIVSANRFSYVPFDELLRRLDISYNSGCHPLFQLLFDTSREDEMNQGKGSTETVKFDLTFNIYFFEDVLHLDTQYACDIFNDNTVQTLSTRLMQFTHRILYNQDVKIKDVSILLDNDNCIIHQLIETEAVIENHNPVHIQIVNKTLDKIAVILDDNKMTYEELIKRSFALSKILIHEFDIKTGDVVVQCLERSFEMIIGIISILMCGAVYCPVHPSEPIERIKTIYCGVEGKLLLTTETYKHIFSGFHNTHYIQNGGDQTRFSLPDIDIEAACYIIHTSGSTGRPKAIQISHKSLLYNICSVSRHPFSCNLSGINIQFSRCSFDVHISDIIGTLFYGGTLVLLDEDRWNDPLYILDTISRNNISYIDIVPSIIGPMYEHYEQTKICLLSVRHVSLGGESCSLNQLQLIKKMFNNLQKISNSYGPAECTITTTVNTQSVETFTKCLQNIGTPLSNYKCLVLDKDYSLVPIQTEGELYIGGPCVMIGYVDSEQNQALIDHKTFGRLYKTGDLVKISEDGNLIYVGRNDDQIKLRGQRIETSEIEQLIYTEIGVSCVVIKHSESLVAYIIGSNDLETDIKNICKKRLPSYMIPSFWVFLSKFPLNSNGKIDRKNLPPPYIKQTEFIAPSSDTDRFVVECASKIFNRQIGMDDDLFLTIGANSLQMMTLLLQLRKKCSSISISDLFQRSSIKEISASIESVVKEDVFVNMIQDRNWNRQDITKCELTPSMHGIFMDELIRTKDRNVYKTNIELEFYDGLDDVNKESLTYILKEIINRHSILHSKFYFQDDKLYQEIVQNYDIDFIEISVSSSELKEYLCKHESRELTLSCFPLLKFTLFNVIDNPKKILLLETHHIVYDHGCDSIYIDEISYFLSRYKHSKSPILEELSLQYIDFSYLQNNLLKEDFIREGYSYWTERLSDIDPYMYFIPTNRLILSTRSGVAGRIDYDLSKHSNTINNIKKSCKTTVHNVLLGMFVCLLYKLTNQNTIVIGGVYENRYIEQTKPMIGYFMNTLPCISQVLSEDSVSGVVKKVSKTCSEILRYSLIPLNHITERIGVQYDKNIVPYSSTMFTEVPSTFEDDSIHIHNSLCKIGDYVEKTRAEFDFTLYVSQYKDRIDGTLEYLVDLYDESSMRTLLKRFDMMFLSEDKNIEEIDIVLPDEHSLIESINNTNCDFGPIKCCHNMIHEYSLKNEDKTAVILDDITLSFRDLIARSINVSLTLRNKYFVKDGDIVIQCLERSVEMIIGMIAIVMVGGVYCPIHPEEPLERIMSLVDDTKSRTMISTQEYKTRLRDCIIDIFFIDQNSNVVDDTMDMNKDVYSTAYMITTSGSTGKPKIMKIQHSSLYNYTLAITQDPYNWNEEQRCLQVCRCSFDVHIMDIYSTLMLGSTVVMLNKSGLYDIDYFNYTVEKYRLTIITTVPSFIGAIFNSQTKSHWRNVKKIALSGEALTTSHISMVREINSKATLINFYGPAECTVNTTGYIVSDIDIYSCPIGKPLKNYKCYILNKKLFPVPVGVIGELYIGGKGLLEEYIDSDQTRSSIILTKSFGRLYKSGDLVKLMSDCNLMYIGRSDFQVKLRGQRLEIGAIENVIVNYKGVKNCIVMKKEFQNQDYLVAYVETDGHIKEELMTECKRNLRNYMVPTVWVMVKEFPLNKNGKIDRKLLQDPQFESQTPFVAPRNKLESDLLSIWKVVSNREDIGTNHDFFIDLNGNSVLGMSMLSHLRKYFGKQIRLGFDDIIEYTTVQSFSEYIITEFDFNIDEL